MVAAPAQSDTFVPMGLLSSVHVWTVCLCRSVCACVYGRLVYIASGAISITVLGALHLRERARAALQPDTAVVVRS